MGSKLLRRFVALGAISGAMLSGCAEERDPINRVQPYALDKTFFLGEDLQDSRDDPEFWTQGTLIDVGYGAAQDGLFTSSYAQPLSRIKWEITEDYLIGRLAYERIEGSDGNGVGGPTNDGIVVCAYKITDHFDIAKDYNSTTGEELNVYIENDTDRPWYERQYIHVDWSQNLNVDSYDFDTLSQLGAYGGVTYETLAYDVRDPSSPDAPYFDLKGGYFDITSKAFAKPGEVDLSHLGWGIAKFPSCFLPPDLAGGTAPVGSCNPVELTIRQSFRRVVDTDYEPAEWDGIRFAAFGAFTSDRYGYAKNYGLTDDRWYRMINRYNIWEKSHFYDEAGKAVECFTSETTGYGEDPHRDADQDGTEDECAAAGEGSRCDEYNQKCTLPFQERVAKPLVWYYTTDGVPEYFDSTSRATHQWDVALRGAVRSVKYAECKAVGNADCDSKFPMYHGQQDANDDLMQLAAEVDACRKASGYKDNCDSLADSLGAKRGYDAAVIDLAKAEEMVVLCHSPVEAGDHPTCGGPRLPAGVNSFDCVDAWSEPESELYAQCQAALNVRRGDLRYHQVNMIPEPQEPSPWGIMVNAHDPITGEAVSASINVWAYVNDFWSQRLIDKLRYLNGEFTTEEITEGENIKDWSTAARAAGQNAPAMAEGEVRERLASVTDLSAAEIPMNLKELRTKVPAKVLKAALKAKGQTQKIRASMNAASLSKPFYSARSRQASNSNVEAALMTPMIQQMTGVAGMPLNDATLNQASLLRGANPTFIRDFYNLKQNALAKRGACILQEAPAPVSYGELSTVLEAKFGNFNSSDSKAVQEARAERMRKYIADRANESVIVHEMGHSVGLRHNFVSSSDAFNYRPQYWQLRTNDGATTELCTSLGNGENCVGPRWFDPTTETEQENMIWMWMHSSTMDYAGEPTQDFLGLGAWDFAATRMFYGDVAPVFMDPSYKLGASKRAPGVIQKLDQFGGIIGFSWSIDDGDETAEDEDEVHYSELNNIYQLINDCKAVNVDDFKPTNWDETIGGEWHPVLDGHIVKVGGQYTRCKQQEVDYVLWNQLTTPSTCEAGGGACVQGRECGDDQALIAGAGCASGTVCCARSVEVDGDVDSDYVSTYSDAGPSVDPDKRLRVPYGFASDNWADLGNLSVYRHDNGADAYELFNFFITSQEVDHIFDNYRRGRATFSVRGSAYRALERYNSKMRDGAKGLSLYKNIYSSAVFSELTDDGQGIAGYWDYLAPVAFGDSILASGMAFDHFARSMARPESGAHRLENADEDGGCADPEGRCVLRSLVDATFEDEADFDLLVPNGAAGFVKNVDGVIMNAASWGGRPLGNKLAEDQGDYNSDYTVGVGSYYEKVFATMLMTESVDNFISDGRTDFLDARYRAVSLADLFPDGFRRWLANNLTGDDFIKGPRIAANADGSPMVDSEGYPTSGIGWTSWWGGEPRSCFPGDGSIVCRSYGSASAPYGAETPEHVAVLDPQVGWEQQKFLVAWTMFYLMENQQQRWIDQMRVWELGVDADPAFENRIEFHHPTGKVYVAKTYGMESIFGKNVQKGVAARVLEYANELLAAGYVTEDGPDLNGDGEPDWYIPVLGDDGQPLVRWDPNVLAINGFGGGNPNGTATCNINESSGCTCEMNRACSRLAEYAELPFFMREVFDAYGLGAPGMRGIY